MQKFYKGRTNNHLTWVMVDATDFASPESAMSAATKIKIYGKLRGATGVNFVSSGTGSLTADIVHVGASVLGIYTIALAKADLSDASAAWYDQYIVSLSATGAAYQMLVVDGGIDDSTMLLLSDAVSNAYSAALQANSRVLVTQSAASDAASAATQINSRVLLNQSRISDMASMLTVMSDILSDLYSDFQSRVPKRVATDSQLSDMSSDLKSYLAGLSSMESDLYSQLSDFRSDLHSHVSTTGVGLHASAFSDIRSAIAGGPAATVTASDISDIASAVWANTIGARVDSRILVNKSAISDVASYLVVMSGVQSDITSALSDAASDLRSLIGATGPTVSDIASAVIVELGGDMSDIRSAIAAMTATVSASDISDIASAVWANTIGARVDSRVLVVKSAASDIYSLLSDVSSDLGVMSGVQSDIYSALSDLQSDFQSRVPKRVATDSQLSDLASDVKSAVWNTPSVNLTKINGTTVNGNGAGVPWGP